MQYKIIIIIFLLVPLGLNAQIRINEIMYDVPGTDSGREWIEVYNSGEEAVDISKWKLLENNVNHSLTLSKGDSLIQPHSYAIIADNVEKFLIDYPQYEGILFDSAFALVNTGGEYLALLNGSITVDSITYDTSLGAAGDGNSISWVGDGFLATEATPGMENSMTPLSSPDTSPTETATSTSGTKEVSSHAKPVVESKVEKISLKINAGRERLVSINTPVEFIAQAVDNKNDEVNGVSYEWSFGDGEKGKGSVERHIYFHPGEYQVVLNATKRGEPAVSRTKVRVIEPLLEITEAKEKAYIELWNRSSDEINIGKWKIENEGNQFIFPQDTIIGKNVKVRFPSEITRLYYHGTTTLFYPNDMQVLSGSSYATTTPEIVSKVEKESFSSVQEKRVEIAPVVAEKKEIDTTTPEDIPSIEDIPDAQARLEASTGIVKKMLQLIGNTFTIH